jgi:hypothetical protein
MEVEISHDESGDSLGEGVWDVEAGTLETDAQLVNSNYYRLAWKSNKARVQVLSFANDSVYPVVCSC